MDKFLVTSDLHLRADRPLCRLDPDWMETQRNMLAELIKIANSNNADILICGDIFDTPTVPASVISLFIQEMLYIRQGNLVHIIAGNHSLKWHKQENLMESSIGILASLNGDTFPIVYHSCEDKTQDGIFEHSVLIHNTTYMLHTLTFDKEDSIPFGARAYSAKQIFEKYPDAEFICTGDNHTAFHVQNGKRHLINPGTPIIQSANMIDYSPICYLIDGHTVEKIDLYNDKTLITNNHLSEKHERDNRISAFVETVKKNGKVSLSFFDNLAKTMEETQVPEEVKSILEELRMEVGNEE